MLFSTIGQGWVFLWMTAAGAAIGAWYALTALARRLLGAGLWLSLAADAVFGLGAAALFCGALVIADYGRFRIYWLLATGVGFACFAAAAFPAGQRLLRGLNRRICRIFVTIGEFRWIKVIFR